MRLFMVSQAVLIASIIFSASSYGQRAFERSDGVIYEDTGKHETNLGRGFNPIPTVGGKVAYIRGRRFGYGEEFDCTRAEIRNSIVVYDPLNKRETTIFDRALDFAAGGISFCIFEQMQISPNGTKLYLVSPVSATSGSLAIVNLSRESISYVHGVNYVFVIESGPHRGELIYQRRVFHRFPPDPAGHYYYPFIHARSDGRPIREISDEFFTVGDNDKLPKLHAYLRKIHGTIHVNGRRLP